MDDLTLPNNVDDLVKLLNEVYPEKYILSLSSISDIRKERVFLVNVK